MNIKPDFNFEVLPLWAQIMIVIISVLYIKQRRFSSFLRDAVENFRKSVK